MFHTILIIRNEEGKVRCTMNLRGKTGLIILICCMAVIAAVVWYCLLTVGRRSSQLDGTFVQIPVVLEEAGRAA